MNILFEFSRLGLADHKDAVELIRTEILNKKHQLTNDLIKSSSKKWEPLPEGVYHSLLKAISSADSVIIEGSTVSLSLGFVLTEAINLGKPVLFLTEEDSISQRNRFAGSIKSKLLLYKSYASLDQLRHHVNDFLIHHDDIKTRFNLVLPNRLNSYVTIQSRRANISKTEYIINLIETDLRSKRG